jgi:2-oxoglutarate/2-oxoacid ferredoxin oxidoreductase subunit alpha
MKYSWKISGPAGYGIKSTGALFAKTLIKEGYYAFYYSEYPSLIRGGHNTVQVDFSKRPVQSSSQEINVLVIFNEEDLERERKALVNNAFVVYDRNTFHVKKTSNLTTYHIPLADLAQQAGGGDIMRNTVSLGATLAIMNLGLEKLNQVLKNVYADKEEKIIKQNLTAARLGHEYVQKNYGDRFKLPLEKAKHKQEKLFLSGNEATALGALRGGCNFFVAYPMTPATAILHYLAKRQRKADIVVHQGEDEIGVIHEALGASFMGARAMVATSGGGFALMNEGLSLSGMTETPVVIAEVMRPAPATGLPTWTDQGDLSFVLAAGHGDFPKIVLAPGDLEESYYLTHKALNLAATYQLPVILLSDKALGESKGITSNSKMSHQLSIQQGNLLEKVTGEYKRYLNTKNGISPRTLPGTLGGEHVCNSDEHDEKGYSVEGYVDDRVTQMDKRQRKMTSMLYEIPGPQIFGKKIADLTLVSWGSNKGPILDALDEINYTIPYSDFSINYYHFSYLWPLPKKKVRQAFANVQTSLLIECNQSAQFGKLLRQETGLNIKAKLLKYDGRPFFREEIIKKIKKFKFRLAKSKNQKKTLFNKIFK